MLCLLRHKLLDLLLETGVFLNGTMDCAREVRSIIEERAQAVEQILRRVIQFVCFGRCDGFNTPNTCRDTGFHHNTYRTNTTGRRYVTTATEFHRRTIFDDTHVIAIFLAEERHSPHGLGFRNRRMTTFLKVQILTDDAICQLLHFAEFFRRHFLEMGEVETQAVGRYQTTLLLHVRS